MIMNQEELAILLFPNISDTPEGCEQRFPKRKLPPNAEVTRIGPSPTGFIHLGNLYSALADERLAHRSGGRFFLRIEDTDNKRKVSGAVEAIIRALSYFGIQFDEGAGIQVSPNETDYSPFFQRERKDIYHVYAKHLVERGFAYPCFCTEDELSKKRSEQRSIKASTGYYGEWATCRNLCFDKIDQNLHNGIQYTLRLKSCGKIGDSFAFPDEIMGDIELPKNFQDIVLLKSDGIPTYHFAHVVDDHLMRTTTVLRGGEWLSSVPIHYELFRILGYDIPKYAHTAQLMKIDNGNKRKLSKRKDPELSLEFYRELGYYPKAVIIYLMTILNSNFEDWHTAHPGEDIEEFPFSLNKMGISGILFDLNKLDDISRNVLSDLTADVIVEFYRTWLQAFHTDELPIYFGDISRFTKIVELNMGKMENRKRKDFVSASQMKDLFSIYFNETFKESKGNECSYPYTSDILREFISSFDISDDSVHWFDKIKKIAEKYNYSVKTSQFKKIRKCIMEILATWRKLSGLPSQVEKTRLICGISSNC